MATKSTHPSKFQSYIFEQPSWTPAWQYAIFCDIETPICLILKRREGNNKLPKWITVA